MIRKKDLRNIRLNRYQ